MNLTIVHRLVEILKGAPEVGSIELRRGLFGVWSSVRVSKAGHTATNAGGTHVGVAHGPASGAAPPLPVAGEGGSGRREAPAPPASQLLEIKSPMVGTFYAAPEPGAPPYVKTGSRLTSGQVVCIIEAMKIMNEIEAE